MMLSPTGAGGRRCRRRRGQGAGYGLMLLALVCLTGLAGAARAALPGDLQALITEAASANQEIRRLASLKTAALEAAKSAGALEDPMFSFILKDIPTDTWSFKQDDMTQKMIMLSQKLPFPGKRRLRTEGAQEQAKSDGFTLIDKVNEVRAKMVQAYYTLSLAYASYELTDKNKRFWEQVVKVAETRYSVGQGMQADVLQAQVELGNYLDRLFKYRQQQESAQADINALRSKPPGTAVPKPQALRPRPFSLKLDELLAQTEKQPQLLALKAMVAKQEKAVALARKEYYPDLTVGVNYGFRENAPDKKRADMFGSTFSINLPIWYKSRLNPQVEEQRARKEAAQAEHQALADRLAAAVKDRYAKLARLSQQIKLVSQGILPQAQQSTQAALAGYQVGSVDFAQLFQAQIMVLNTEIQLQEYLKDFEENWAELEWLVGSELTRSSGGSR